MRCPPCLLLVTFYPAEGRGDSPFDQREDGDKDGHTSIYCYFTQILSGAGTNLRPR